MKDLSKGYIALYRQFIDWEWFTDVNTCHLFQYCLLRANYKDTKWRGAEIKKGQFVTSYEKLSIDTGLTIRQVRTALNKLKNSGEVTHKTTNRNSIITVNNWKEYQESDKQNVTKTAFKRQANDKQTTTDNKDNKRDINKLISLSIEEREKLKKYIYTKKKNVKDADAYIRRLIDNGDISVLIEKAKKWEERQEEKKEETGIKREDFQGVTAESCGNSLKDVMKRIKA